MILRVVCGLLWLLYPVDVSRRALVGFAWLSAPRLEAWQLSKFVQDMSRKEISLPAHPSYGFVDELMFSSACSDWHGFYSEVLVCWSGLVLFWTLGIELPLCLEYLRLPLWGVWHLAVRVCNSCRTWRFVRVEGDGVAGDRSGGGS